MDQKASEKIGIFIGMAEQGLRRSVSVADGVGQSVGVGVGLWRSDPGSIHRCRHHHHRLDRSIDHPPVSLLRFTRPPPPPPFRTPPTLPLPSQIRPTPQLAG